MKFIKYIFATLIGISLFFGFLALVVVGLLGVLAGGEEIPTIKENSVLKLTLSKPIYEKGKADPFEELGISTPEGLNLQAKTSLHKLRDAILFAKDDDRIKGIYLHINSIQTGYASMLEIRDALETFNSSGKFIYVYGEYFTEGAYFLASVGDKIMLNPTGALELNGLHSEVMFYTGMFEKLGIEPQIFRVGDFKAAVEPFFRKNMSDENRLQTQVLLHDLYDFYIQKVSDSRGISYTAVKNISDSMLVRNATNALDYQLVTDTIYEDGAFQKLREKLALAKDSKINFVSLSKYLKVVDNEGYTYSSNKVAVILTEGNIANQKGNEDEISPADIIKQLRKVRQDENIKAVILRINSPGGSLLGSDNLWKEIQLLKAQKPVIASMSDMAASGGYYMAMGCDKIVASPVTITGSIGIFGLTFEIQGLTTGWAGLTFDRVKTGVFSDLGNPNRPFTESERQIIQASVEEGYQKFTSKAATGRKMSLDSLLKVASGRVWSGKKAHEIRLVDELGGFQKAVDLALKASKLPKDDYMLEYYPKQQKLFESLLNEGEVYYRTQTLRQELGIFYPYFSKIQALQKRQGIQAWSPFEVKF